MEQTVVMLKPDALERNLHWPLLKRIQDKCGLALVELGMYEFDEDELDTFYGHQAGQDFFEDMVAYLARGPVIIAIFEGEDAIAKVRAEVGPYTKDARGTIRCDHGDRSKPNYVNLLHASDTEEEARDEINFFFEY